MFWKKSSGVFASVLLLLVSACNLPGGLAQGDGTSQDPTAAIQTQVAAIIASTEAAQTELANAVASTLTMMATNTPEFTFTPSLTPTQTFTPTQTLTPTPTLTLTPSVPMVSVSRNINCRSGPGESYAILGILNVGETAEVLGRNASGDTWIIKLPSNPAITCWLWGAYASVTGSTAALPISTPPPTPTPPVTFSVVFTNTITCAPDYAFHFEITNNGSLTWQSIRLTITDNTTAAVFVHTLDNFKAYNDCALELNQQDLTPGETGPVTNVNPGQLGYNPTGHSITAVFRLCSENGLAGTCLEKTLSFTP
jgi:hypothetical protein